MQGVRSRDFRSEAWAFFGHSDPSQESADAQHGINYTEKWVNQKPANFNEETARLRRSPVEHRFTAREGGGEKYWRIDS